MKTILKILLLIFLIQCSLLSQTDSIIKTKSINCLVNKKCFKKNPIFKNIELVDDSIEINKVKRITFINNDSLHLIKGQSKVYALNLKDLREVSVKSGTHWFTGLILGCLAGGLISGGVASGMNDYPAGNYTTIGVVSGTVVGGVIGALLGSGFDDYETLNLLDIPSADKKSKLLEFLRQKR